MAKFLNTSATNFFLEELIKNAKERLILISPGEFKHEVRQFEKSYDNQQAEQISLMV